MSQPPNDYDVRFSGIKRLVGIEGLGRLKSAHVCVVGVGGVGSWTAEALARSGIGQITLIDLDEVCVSNVNRQLPALTAEVGKTKVSVLKERIYGINPECSVEAVEEFFTESSAERLLSVGYSSVVDAIDSLTNKCLLIAQCRDRNIPLVTIGAAGGRRDPTAIKIADLALASHDRLLRSVRKVLRNDYGFPKNDLVPFGIRCVFSSELPVFPQNDGTICAKREANDDLRINCESGLGTATFVTGTFGFVAAGEVVRQLSESPNAGFPNGNRPSVGEIRQY